MDKPKPKVFLDSCAVVSGVMSPRHDSEIRQLFKLGEASIIDLRVSQEVLSDAEWVIRKRRESALPLLAYLIDLCNFYPVLNPSDETVSHCIEMTGYLPDARVLAAAVECDADLFVTFDTEHFLQNPLIGPPKTKLRVVNAHQALEWLSDFVAKQIAEIGEGPSDP